jgi:prepilin-type N-terminal cleavage/methylation domain-containing protein
MTLRTDHTDAGFTLVEVLASLAVIGIVMTAVTTFFVRSMVSIAVQGSRQAAIQLAADGMERMRDMPGSSVYAFLQSSDADTTISANGINYRRTWSCTTDTGAACQDSSLVLGPTVTVSWPDKACSGGTCKYSATTMISTAQIEPIFDPAAS